MWFFPWFAVAFHCCCGCLPCQLLGKQDLQGHEVQHNRMPKMQDMLLAPFAYFMAIDA
jgi:hypothetical protein